MSWNFNTFTKEQLSGHASQSEKFRHSVRHKDAVNKAQCSHRSAPRGMPSRKGAVTQPGTQAKAPQSANGRRKCLLVHNDKFSKSASGFPSFFESTKAPTEAPE